MIAAATLSRRTSPRSRSIVRRSLLLGGLLLAAACATPVGVDPITPREFERELTASALSVDQPSRFSDQVLQRFNLRERFETEPAQVCLAWMAGGPDGASADSC